MLRISGIYFFLAAMLAPTIVHAQLESQSDCTSDYNSCREPCRSLRGPAQDACIESCQIGRSICCAEKIRQCENQLGCSNDPVSCAPCYLIGQSCIGDQGAGGVGPSIFPSSDDPVILPDLSEDSPARAREFCTIIYDQGLGVQFNNCFRITLNRDGPEGKKTGWMCCVGVQFEF